MRHKNAWMLVTGGMIILGTINVVLGYLFWPSPAVEDTSVPIPDVKGVLEAAAARAPDAGADLVNPAAADASITPDAPPTPDAP